MAGPPLPAPGSPGAPNYWMHEASGALRPAVEAYLLGRWLSPRHVDVLREYFKQWVGSPVWLGPEVDQLRVMVDQLRTCKDIEAWLDLAEKAGMDPL